jgi:hypothetical protein
VLVSAGRSAHDAAELNALTSLASARGQECEMKRRASEVSWAHCRLCKGKLSINGLRRKCRPENADSWMECAFKGAA